MRSGGGWKGSVPVDASVQRSRGDDEFAPPALAADDSGGQLLRRVALFQAAFPTCARADYPAADAIAAVRLS
jgi:hypothetical protein